MKKIFLASFAIATLFVGCSKGEMPDTNPDGGEQQPGVLKMPINISMSGWTKVTDTDYETGDKVGLYVVNFNGDNAGQLQQSGNHVDNMRFVNKSGTWTPDQEIYWKDQTTKADFYCYFPYTESPDTETHPLNVMKDQSTDAGYKASEFLWGKASNISPTDKAVPVITNRLTSNIIVYIAPGNGYTEESLGEAEINVEITNVKTSADVNLATGTITATGETATVKPIKEGGYFRAMMIPQTVADGTNLVNITIDGVKYTYTKGVTFEPNKKHKFTITVNKVNGGIDIGVGGWEESENDYGGAAE